MKSFNVDVDAIDKMDFVHKTLVCTDNQIPQQHYSAFIRFIEKQHQLTRLYIDVDWRNRRLLETILKLKMEILALNFINFNSLPQEILTQKNSSVRKLYVKFDELRSEMNAVKFLELFEVSNVFSNICFH